MTHHLMTQGLPGLGQIDRLIWSLIAGTAALVLAAATFDDFTVVWRSFLAPGSAALALAAGQYFYQRHRPDPRLAGSLGTTAQLLAFAAVGAPLSYVGASLNLPLHDVWLDQTDRALGFDWSAILAWMNANADLHPIFRAIYLSLMPQTVIVVLALGWIGKLAELRVFMLAFVLATLATIAIAAVVPAQGVWGHYGLQQTDYANIRPATREMHLAVFNGLRHGTFRELLATGAEGIITFPSLHSALAVLLTVALWPVPLLRWAGVLLNTGMLLSIPVDGGHYVTDMIAGVVIAAAAWAVARWLVARLAAPAADAMIPDDQPAPFR